MQNRVSNSLEKLSWARGGIDRRQRGIFSPCSTKSYWPLAGDIASGSAGLPPRPSRMSQSHPAGRPLHFPVVGPSGRCESLPGDPAAPGDQVGPKTEDQFSQSESTFRLTALLRCEETASLLERPGGPRPGPADRGGRATKVGVEPFGEVLEGAVRSAASHLPLEERISSSRMNC